MAKKTSQSQKAAYATYKAENRAEKNKKARIARHLKKHPNDSQSQRRVAPANAGHSPSTVVTKDAAALSRAVQHHQLFGQTKVRKVSGRDLSTSGARKAFLKSIRVDAKAAA